MVQVRRVSNEVMLRRKMAISVDLILIYNAPAFYHAVLPPVQRNSRNIAREKERENGNGWGGRASGAGRHLRRCNADEKHERCERVTRKERRDNDNKRYECAKWRRHVHTYH